MIYLNLEKDKANKKIDLNNITVEYPNNEKGIHVFSNDKNLFIVDGFFFPSNKTFKKFGIDFLDNHAELLEKLDESSVESYLKEIDGFFNVYIFDLKNSNLKVFSDHVGSRTVYFYYSDGNLFLSNYIEYILKKFNLKKLNEKKITEYFSLMNNFGGVTFFKNLYEIKARECIIFEKGSYKRKQYFDFQVEVNNLSEEENSKILKKTFIESVQNCTELYDGLNSVALSGGLDSSSITSAVKLLGNKSINAKTIYFETKNNKLDKSYELNYSSHVAKKLQIKQDIITLSDTGCISSLTEIDKIFYEPKNLINGYIHLNIFKNLAKGGGKVYLDGFAGDSVINHGYSLFSKLAKKFHFAEIFRLDKKLYENKGGVFSYKKTFFKYILPTFIPQRILWLVDSFRNKKNIYKRYESRLKKGKKFKNLFSEILKRYESYPNSFSKSPEEWHLMNVNSTEITSSIRDARILSKHYDFEIIFPFLSKKLIQVSLNIPIEQKFYNGIDRFIFRKAMDEIVPKKILERNTKSDLSYFSKQQMTDVNFKKIEKLIDNRCPNLFDKDYLREEVFLKGTDTTESFQVYEFVQWLEKNDIFLE